MTCSSQHTSTNNAFVTLLTCDHYLPGVLVLAESLRLCHGISRKGKHGAGASTTPAADFQVVALITPDTLSVQSVRALRRSGLFDWIVGVEPIGFRQILASSPPSGIPKAANDHAASVPSATLDSELNDKILEMERNLNLLGRPDLTNTLTKLHAWRLGRDSAHLIVHGASSTHDAAQVWQGFDKLVFLDADTMVLRPIDHLFRLESKVHFAAAPDTGWPDAFNSGVMMLTPSNKTFEAIRSFARTTGSWDGADQGLLNDFYGPEDGSEDVTAGAQGAASAPGGGWKRLSFRYNVTSHGGYTFAPAYQRYGQSINIVHFIGQHKPWNRPRLAGLAEPNPLVGPRDLDSQSITPDQPDYLLAIWHSAFASLYPSSGSTSPDSEIEIVHTERGVEVVERRKFTVPTFHAVWDAEARQGNVAPRADNSPGASGPAPALENQPASEAAYASLPLDGRTSLIAPAPEVARAPSPPTPTQESIDAELRAREAAQAAPVSAPIAIPARAIAKDANDSDDSPQHFSPPKLSWKPAHEPPPSGSDASLYQMRTPIDAFYSNAWDAGQKTPRTPAEQKAAFFVPQNAAPKQSGGRPQGGPGYIPPQLRRDRVFDNLGSHQPDPSKVKPIFPWESKQSTSNAPTRVFPDEPRRPSPPPSADTTPKLGSTQGGSLRPPASAPAPAPPPAPVQRPRGLPANLSFVNAWDQAGAIGNFANAWTRHTHPPSPDRRRSRQAETSYSGASSRDPSSARPTDRRRNAGGSNGSLRSDAPPPISTFRPSSAVLLERRSSLNNGEDARDGEASDSRDGDDESSDDEESSGHEDMSQVVTERDATPSPTNSRQAGWPREGPGRGYMKKAENSVHAQMHATPRSPRMTARVLPYASTATEGEGRSGGRFSSSSSASNSTVTSERAAAASQRARDRIRPDGWISTGSAGSGMSSPPPGYPAASSLRGIPGIAAGGAFVPSYPSTSGKRRETNSSNESQSGESGANSPTALLSPTIGGSFGSTMPLGGGNMTVPRSFGSVAPQPVPSRVSNPPSLDEPFSSSPANLRTELSQQARTNQQAKYASAGRVQRRF
ncbi:related to glycogenin-2 beta [Sporisorium scitamineum]|uniref:Related to glycogenin-2 beta n=1 Tax=Sporisorium scitamineum TaxID=49012 RepID=A0A127ZFC1_9BASI|nr:related to glycogenin-2 beta [Sporisorium scitamineum]